MPTKVEQSDLLSAMFGRHGECPIPVIAAARPSECFHMILEAFRIAIKYMTPVILLSDAFLANSAEPWKLPDIAEIPDLSLQYCNTKEGFLPYQRDPITLSRPWAIPGTKGLEHRIGGLEKEQGSGNISYDPDNHQAMVNTRAAKIQGIENDLPPLEILGKDHGSVLIIGWGSTYGAIRTVVEQLQEEGFSVSAIHLRYLNPFQKTLGATLKHFQKVLVVELNSGQLCHLLRARFLVDAQGINKVAGKPFSVSELKTRILPYLEQ
jgi:2-oxoglutarate ferredoxin oxidoreductase subunit alpha